MLAFGGSIRIFIFAQPTDMRCGFNKLSMLVQAMMGHDPLSGHLFVFFNKRGDRCKILFWDRTGFCIWYKQLQQGTFQRIINPDGKVSLEIDRAKLMMIMEGIELSKAKQRKRFRQK